MAGVVVIFAVCLCSIVEITSLEFQYHSQSEMETFLNSVTQTYPNLTRLYSIGKTIKGQELWVLAVGKNNGDYDPLRPNVKYIGNMHGNEVIGREVLLHLIEHFLIQYSTNSTIQQFLDTTLVHIMPTMNPDGWNISIEGDCMSGHGRGNANGFDLNRNFPEVISSENPNAGVIQPETQAVIDWIHNTTFVLSANLHGGELVANYPFDHYYTPGVSSGASPSPDDDTFKHLALTFSKSHGTMSTNNCEGSNFKDGITNGAEWYAVYGGMQDYNYLAVGTFELTLEISCCKYPMASELPQFWEDNRDAFINYLMEAHMGVKGLVVDVNDNALADVTLVIVGREFVPFRSSASGAYFRLLLPGTYQIQASQAGYLTTTEVFTVVSGAATRLDIYMKPTDKIEDRSAAQSLHIPRPSSVFITCSYVSLSAILSVILGF